MSEADRILWGATCPWHQLSGDDVVRLHRLARECERNPYAFGGIHFRGFSRSEVEQAAHIMLRDHPTVGFRTRWYRALPPATAEYERLEGGRIGY